MPLLFGILTALVLATSTWIGFKNQKEYEKQIQARIFQEKDFAARVKDLDKLTADWEDTIKRKETLIAENEVLTDEIAELESKITAIKAEIAQKDAKKKQLEAEVLAATEVMDKVGGVRALVPKIRGLRSDIAALEAEIEEGNTTLSNLKQTKADTEASIAKNEERVEFETTGKSQPFLSTTIKTVYASWGFVTLNGGDIQGVVPGSTLSVMRGDDVVAKLKVTTVEPNRAAADIMVESMAADVILMGGDKVVPEAIPAPAPEPAPEKKVTAN
jgi:prefoldin subunit 5